jgi:uncharacterized protein (TIGR02996 family)
MAGSLTRPKRTARPTGPAAARRSSPLHLAALDEALALWRETRVASIAEAIDALTETALAGWEPPVPRTNQAFHAAWLAAVADNAERGWAARTILSRLPGSDGDQRSAACCQRLAALAAAPPDPRIGRAVVELIGQQLQILGYASVLDAIIAVLAVHGDDRTAAIAHRRLDTADPTDASVIQRALAAQPAAERAATPAELERFADRRARNPAARAQIEALVHEVHAHPDADDARLVLADALLAHGDPRGELIALQLADPRNDRQLDRIEQLLREYGKHWLGTVREITFRARFQRGFLARLELNGRWTATERGWAQHVADPTLATVEDLIPGRSVGAIYARFLTSPAMTALRRIEVFDAATLDALRESPANLVHVACPTWKSGKYVPQLASQVLPACERFPDLRSFAVYIDGASSVMASRLFAQLTSLTIAGGLAPVLALWPRLPRSMSLTIARSAMLDDCVTTRVAWTGALHLTRDGARVIARASGDWLIGELLDHFAALPSDLQQIEVEGAGDHASALTEAARRRHIQLILLPLARRTGYIAGLDR